MGRHPRVLAVARFLRILGGLKFLRTFLIQSAIALGLVRGLAAQETLSDWLNAPGVDMKDPAQRAAVVAKARAQRDQHRQAAQAKAKQLGLPTRHLLRNGRTVELMDFIGNRPVYFTTHNVNAAISTGANLLQAAPYSMNGTGVTVGEWDAGSARTTHQEFGGRVTAKDGAAAADHSTHVGGTIAAAGVVAAAKGMAPSVLVDSYEWTNDKSEMTARGASYPGEAGKIYLSNHSYGFIEGWNYTGKASPMWDWWGTGTNSAGTEQDFGKYDTNARDDDSLAFSLPYYLVVRSAGNDRADNPSTGDPVSLTAGGTSAVSYNPASHPAGDGVYKGNGYDTMSADAVAKNVLSIGAVADAVSGGVRAPANGTMSYFSSWGPTDDGRIKPDLVANGDNLYSSIATSNSAYATYSGTSMAAPNATGSAALLVQWWDHLFPGHAMRASTLKALLIQTADDLGTPGPDYQNGWGLINVKAAADLAQAYKDSPGTRRIIEDQVITTAVSRSYTFAWDGSSPIRATLCWTDPAGTAVTASDSRTEELVNNLDLKINGPAGTLHQPWVMPYVGTWTNANLSAPATTGVNNTDNVEQVFIASPPAAGNYTAVVTFSGTLTNGSQKFSLIISGGATSAVAAAPTASSLAPNTGTGTTTLTLVGANFLLGANVKLTKAGQSDVAGTGQEVIGNSVKFRINTSGMAAGLWNAVVTNPDGQTVSLQNAFSIVGPAWQDTLESGATGWTHSATSPYTTDNWTLSTAQSHSATHSFFAAAQAGANIDDLYSPSISIPAAATNLQLTFWHYYNLQNTKDAGVLEFSVNNGAWFDVLASGSGASFASGGYNSAISSGSNPLNGRQAWTGDGGSFTQVAVNLTDTAKYAGNTLRIRWRLATNSTTASTGWYVDDAALAAVIPSSNLAPAIVNAASATSATVTGLSSNLSVTASDDAGEPALTYTWSYTGGTFQTPVSFSENGNNIAKTTTATFTAAGSYTFTVTVRDAEGLTATSSVDVVVQQTPAGITVTPSSVSKVYGETQIFTASVLDQFGAALAAQPDVTWSTNGGGSIAADGTFTANAVGGPFNITATSGSITGTANVTVTKAAATVTLGSLSQTYSGTQKSATATTSPSGLAVTFTYDGSTTAPTNAGSYAVVGTNNDANYTGSASGTFVVSKATASVTLASLAQTYDGNQKSATASTTPSNLTVNFTYDGFATAPVDFGSYAVVAAINDTNYSGSASGTLVIAGQTLASWRAQYFTPAEITAGLADDMADPDGDGWSNLAEYALGTDPRNSTPDLSSALDDAGLTLTFTRPKALPDVIYSAESSTDFLTWNPLTLELVADGAVQTLRARVLFIGAIREKQFIRLRFSR